MDASSSKRLRRRRLPGEQRREHLLDVAAEMLRDDGFEALTMERLAERAGVSKGLGYAYFTNAEQVAVSLFEREVTEIYRRVEGAMSAPGAFQDRLRRALGAYLDTVSERRGVFAVLQTKLSGRRLARGLRRRIDSFVDFWAAQIEAEFGTTADVAKCLAGGVLRFCDACARSWLGGVVTRAQVEDLCVDFVFSGLRAAAPADRVRVSPGKPMISEQRAVRRHVAPDGR